ncbi:hypothetical protein THRCLA_22106 [Thraustotheca clavata]|uniref:Uncharacterized protein n=1 Tax=Thraustotheca clavata TaxID=74557 RepID=A0A1V9ZCE7_9STRA|nr:hypothetical protein THRCLA_22106 [Thraustotheca clavata]
MICLFDFEGLQLHRFGNNEQRGRIQAPACTRTLTIAKSPIKIAFSSGEKQASSVDVSPVLK